MFVRKGMSERGERKMRVKDLVKKWETRICLGLDFIIHSLANSDMHDLTYIQ
jgi:hypothetical protein